MKVSVIGAGNVGAMTASRIIDADLADVALVDIVPGLAKGKALDISDARPIFNSKSRITGFEDFDSLRDSGVVVVTAGLARKPGMSRDDLLRKNSEIIKTISAEIKRFSPRSIVIVITNPLDVMTYLTLKETGFAPEKVMGMAGVLDSSRFINALCDKQAKTDTASVFMMGSHGDTMVPINRSESLDGEAFNTGAERAKNRGAEIVGHLKTGSAYFSPSASAFYMVKAILKDEKNTLCASAYLNGQYGEKDICIGVPIVLGANGIEKIIEIDLTKEEKTRFTASAKTIKTKITTLQ